MERATFKILLALYFSKSFKYFESYGTFSDIFFMNQMNEFRKLFGYIFNEICNIFLFYQKNYEIYKLFIL